MKWYSAILVFGMSMFALAQQAAAQSDPLIEGAKLCTRHLPRYEREYAIPTHLLSAIASTESGRYHEGLKMKLPWPWAINAEGKGYWFDSKEQAIAAVKRLRARGIKSIDVGCMQVNLLQHPDAFASLDQAFDPEKNIGYAASFLHTLYEESNSWKTAASYYHSRTPSLGREYVGNVYSSWFSIIDKLRAARLHVPEASVVAMNEMKSNNVTPVVRAGHKQIVTRVDPHVIRLADVRPAARSKTLPLARNARTAPVQAKAVAAREHPHMNKIEVTTVASAEEPARDRSVLMMRQDSAQPEMLPAEMRIADNTPLQTPIPDAAPALKSDPAAAAAALTLATERRPVLASVSRKAGPNFIFND